MDIPGVVDADEELVGSYFFAGTNNLQRIDVTLPPSRMDRNVTLKVDEGSGIVKIWKEATRTNSVVGIGASEKTWATSEAVPSSMYVEGLPCLANTEVHLELSYEGHGGNTNAVDWVKLKFDRGAVDELTGTAMFDGNRIPSNSLTVNSVTTDKLYVCPSNEVELSITSTPANLLPENGCSFLFKVSGTGASPSSGDFSSGNPVISLGTGLGSAIYYDVYVGVDENGDGTLESSEETHKFRIQKIDFSLAEIYANRTSTPVESSFPARESGEHYEAGGTFKWELKNSFAEDAVPMNYEYWDIDGFDELIETGPGTEFSRTITSSALELDDIRIRFFCDANGDFGYDSGEQKKDVEFKVKERKIYNFNVEMSDRLSLVSLSAMQAFFTDAEHHVLRKDSENDWRACVKFNVVSLNQFIHGPDRPDPVDAKNDPECNKHFNATDVTFVKELYNAWARAALPLGTLKLLAGPMCNSNVLAHEIGHGVGLKHHYPDRPDGQIMHKYNAAWGTELRHDDVDDFE